MRLLSLSYDQESWHLQDLHLAEVALLVGKNATGKSKALGIIDRLARIVTQNTSVPGRGKWSVNFLLKNGQKLNYEFAFEMVNSDSLVVYERMTLNDQVVINRPTSDSASLLNSLNEKFDEVNPPDSKLIIHISRDVKRYPWIEELATWGERSYGFKFGNIGPDRPIRFSGRDTFFTPLEDLPNLVDELTDVSKNRIISDLNSIGFKISSIRTVGDANSSKLIFIREEGVKQYLTLRTVSQGFYRCIVLTIFLEYLVQNQKPSMVVIDDLGEGLDYERATKLGKLIFKKCLDSNIQLIATSNDMFLMDVVDIKFWNVLFRKNQFVHSVNPNNHKKLFLDFKFTGLSNFDFFSSDYIKRNDSK